MLRCGRSSYILTSGSVECVNRPGGGGTCCPKGYGFWASFIFGLKTGIHFAHFGMESGMVFEGTTEAYELFCRFNSE